MATFGLGHGDANTIGHVTPDGFGERGPGR